MPVSPLQAAKRALVSILLQLARRYKVKVTVSRDATDKDIQTAYKRIALKVHPDKGAARQMFRS